MMTILKGHMTYCSGLTRAMVACFWPKPNPKVLSQQCRVLYLTFPNKTQTFNKGKQLISCLILLVHIHRGEKDLNSNSYPLGEPFLTCE